jgi:hypothetical protein
MFVLRDWQLPVSNLGPKAACPRSFVVFLSTTKQSLGLVTSFHSLIICNHPDVRRHIHMCFKYCRQMNKYAFTSSPNRTKVNPRFSIVPHFLLMNAVINQATAITPNPFLHDHSSSSHSMTHDFKNYNLYYYSAVKYCKYLVEQNLWKRCEMHRPILHFTLLLIKF